MIKACLFDIGNVLVSFDYLRTFGKLPAGERSYEEIRAHLSTVIAELETGRLSTEAFIERAVAFMGGTAGDFRTAFTEIFEPIQPVWDALEEVRAAVPVYLFSNTSELHETHLFERFPGFSRFDGGFYSWRVGFMKPHSEIYEHALKNLGLPASSVAYIDDLPENIETGRRMGFKCHQYDRTRHGELLLFLDECGLRSR